MKAGLTTGTAGTAGAAAASAGAILLALAAAAGGDLTTGAGPRPTKLGERSLAGATATPLFSFSTREARHIAQRLRHLER
jgi:hypothetical protein